MSSGQEHAHEITSPGRPETVEVASGVYAYIQPDGTWWINNTGFVTGPQGVFSIDACSTERRTRAYLAAIRRVTASPVRTLVNTHHHGDHTFGNALFPAATIVAHERARAEVIAFGPARDLPFWDSPDWGQLPLEPPFLTFTDEIALHAGDTRITVKHVGTAAHTTNDVLAWFPEQSVLFCGDLVFNGGTPFLLMGSVTGAVEALEQVVLPLGARIVVPGHGPVFEGSAPIAATLDYLRFVLDVAERGRAAGVPPLEAARGTDLGRFAGGRTRSASSATCTAPTPNSTAPRAAARSTSWARWPRWSPTTAASPSPAWPERGELPGRPHPPQGHHASQHEARPARAVPDGCGNEPPITGPLPQPSRAGFRLRLTTRSGIGQ